MDKLKLAFKRANLFKPLDLFLRLKIGRYIHVELVFPEKFIQGRNSFSSRGRGKPKGVGFKQLDYSKGKWDWIELDYTEQDILRLRQVCIEFAQKRPLYDLKGAIMWAGFDIPKDDVDKWFCSEIIAFLLKFKPYKITPVELWNAFLE